jgi:hypothetical protein
MEISEKFYIAQHKSTQKWVRIVWDDEDRTKIMHLTSNVLAASRYKDRDTIFFEIKNSYFNGYPKYGVENFLEFDFFELFGKYSIKKLDIVEKNI